MTQGSLLRISFGFLDRHSLGSGGRISDFEFRSASIALLAIGSLALSSPPNARALDWYRWRGPDLNGISSETGWQSRWSGSGPKVAWRASVGTGFSSFSVADGRVYTMGNSQDTDTVFCFDAATGTEIWKHSYACPLDPKFFDGGPGATPTVAGDRLYTVSRSGDVFCLDTKNGAVIWSRNLAKDSGLEAPTWGFAGSALVEGNLVFLDMGSAGVALDKNTGRTVWISGKDAGGYSTPVSFGGTADRALALVSKASLVAVRPADGRELWHYPWQTQYDVNAADPIIAGDKVFVSSGYGHGCALVKITGNRAQTVWQNKNMRNHFNSCVLWRDFLYGVDENQLRCLAFETGQVRWTRPEFGKGSLMLADGKLIGMSERGDLIIAEASPEAFKPISRAQVLSGRCWTTPVLSNGRIYCRNAAGQVVCVDVK